MPSLGALIAARAKRDPKFKEEVLLVLRKKLAAAEPKSEHAKKLQRACAAFEKL
jgi:hypothetical protein